MSKYGFKPGDFCYKFRLDSLISNPANSNSDVWLATDTATDQRVALKIMDAAFNQVPARLFEAKVGAKLKHANLCEVVGADVFQVTRMTSAGQSLQQYAAIGFAYQAEGTCTKLLKGPGMMPLRKVHRLLLNVLSGLEYLHEAGWMHNDIKPANILVGAHAEFMLTDYGISWAPIPGIPPAKFYVPHIPPESIQAPGEAVPRHTPTVQTDLYQLGVTAYRLLNGIGGFRDVFSRYQAAGQVPEFFRLVCEGKLPDRNSFHSSVPQSIRRIVCKAMSLGPQDRYASALEMRRDLEKLKFPYQWEFTPTNEMQCVRDNAILTVEEVQGEKGLEICMVKTYQNSGKVVRPPVWRRVGLTQRQADAHRKKLMQEAIKIS